MFSYGIASNLSGFSYSYPAPVIFKSSLRLGNSPTQSELTGTAVLGQFVYFSGAHFGTLKLSSLLSVICVSKDGAVSLVCQVDFGNAYTSDSQIACITAPASNITGLHFVVTTGYNSAATNYLNSSSTQQYVMGSDVFNYPEAPVVYSVSGCQSGPLNSTVGCPTNATFLTNSSAIYQAIRLTINGRYFDAGSYMTVSVGSNECLNTVFTLGSESSQLTCDLPVGAGVQQQVGALCVIALCCCGHAVC